METKQDESNDNSNRYRKFGLPSWMVNNIERLNFVTDFEQYACSPPETEGFLSEHTDSHEFHETYCPVVDTNDSTESKPKTQTENKADVETKQPSSDHFMRAVDHVPAYHSILTGLKHEDLYSSPDSTPCATPEPSPAPRRKMSGQQDTVQTNPGRWFYLGNFKNPDQNMKSQCFNVISNKEKKSKNSEKSSDIPLRQKDTSVKPKKDGIKLVISNFDINAISPTSW